MNPESIEIEEDYPWYGVADESEILQQGDIIKDCPLIHPSSILEIKKDASIESDVDVYDVVIMSQSCDLENHDLDIVLVCPLHPLSYFEGKSEYYKGKRGKEELRKCYLPGYLLLNKCNIEQFKQDYKILDFRNVYGVPFELLTELAKKQDKRLRLLPPYREHLSQSFAKFFMRVGLPIEIKSFI